MSVDEKKRSISSEKKQVPVRSHQTEIIVTQISNKDIKFKNKKVKNVKVDIIMAKILFFIIKDIG